VGSESALYGALGLQAEYCCQSVDNCISTRRWSRTPLSREIRSTRSNAPIRAPDRQHDTAPLTGTGLRWKGDSQPLRSGPRSIERDVTGLNRVSRSVVAPRFAYEKIREWDLTSPPTSSNFPSSVATAQPSGGGEPRAKCGRSTSIDGR